jgi:nucleoside-diphosphate-sugar epimerase
MTLRILITGGAGYLGSILCEHLLNAAYEITVIDRLIYGQHSLFHLCNNPRLNFVLGDVRDEAVVRRLIKDADVILPLAAIVGAPACDRDPLFAQSVNLDAVRMLNRLRSPNQLIIFPTTNSGYGTKSNETHCTEDTPLEPISLYGQTKVMAEAELLETPNTISLRLATLFGMSPRLRLDLLVNHFTYAATTDGYIVIFQKDFKRNYIHLRDVADCFIHCIKNAKRMTGKPYNVGLDSANLSKAELAMKVKEYVPNFYIHFSEVGSDPDKRNYVVSSDRLRRAGFEARRSLDQGIQELLKGYRMLGRSSLKNV